jgi:hypothetical protein
MEILLSYIWCTSVDLTLSLLFLQQRSYRFVSVLNEDGYIEGRYVPIDAPAGGSKSARVPVSLSSDNGPAAPTGTLGATPTTPVSGPGGPAAPTGVIGATPVNPVDTK